MKCKSLLFAVCTALGFAACDTTTDTLGSSLTNNLDHLEISTDTFTITTRSIAIDSVLAKGTVSYLGTIRDPETGQYISANYMTQFHTLEDYKFPELDSIMSRNDNNEIIADSCELKIVWNKFYGDSLSSMKCTVFELSKPMSESVVYYSNFNPMTEGLVRSKANGGMQVSKTYTLEDLNVDKSLRTSTSIKNIRIPLNQPYTDKDGKTYNNYGTYIMRKYYKEYGGDSTFFKNSIRLTNNVIPGFYIESSAGLGCMAKVSETQLKVYFDFKSSNKTKVGTASFVGTQEVMQRTNYITDKNKIKELVSDNTCTYLKTPAGIFTEVTLPIDEICYNHDNDTINSARFVLQRINNEVKSDYNLDIPSTVLLIPADSINSFFETKSLANNKLSYLATYSKEDNIYTFNNIGTMIRAMQKAKQKGETSANWNKAVVIPVTTEYNSSSVLIGVDHDMSLSSTKLVGGSDNPYGEIKISVIYSKYE